MDTVKINTEGRYEIRLPWLSDHPPVPTNYFVAQKRLKTTLAKLNKDNNFNLYDKIFKEWKNLNIIEEVGYEKDRGHFLPHRPVFKENSTTAIRPVFDASTRAKDAPSLNMCLEKGPNLIELIPNILIRFREFRIGITADIKKAFLQIEINKITEIF